MTVNRLNDLTRQEIEDLLAQYYNKETNAVKCCLWCGKTFHANRKWQEFCNDSHRTQFHKNRQLLEIERLQAALASMTRDRDELREQLARRKE